MKKFFKKFVVSLMAVCMMVPVYTMTAHAEIIEFLDPYMPQDDRTGLYKFEHYDTDWDATVHTYAECVNRARSEAIQRTQTYALQAEADKTGYPFIKISARDFLCNYELYGYNDNGGYYFDAASYAAMYPEVKAKYGNKFSDLWNHYKTIGVYEGKVAHTNAGWLVGYDTIMALYEVWTPEMTDREKVIFVNNYLCQRMLAVDDSTMWDNVADVEADPMFQTSFSFVFKEIMRQLGIPCFTEFNYDANGAVPDDTSWNQVYVDGQWYVVDVYANDFTGTDQYLLINRHPNAYPDSYCEKNIEVYDTYVLKPSYTEADFKEGRTSAMWGPREFWEPMLDQDWADAMVADWEQEVNELNNTRY